MNLVAIQYNFWICSLCSSLSLLAGENADKHSLSDSDDDDYDDLQEITRRVSN